MNPPNPLAAVRTAVVGRLGTWSAEQQLRARRNAMVACTALAARRAEREDVEAFLSALKPRTQVLRAAVNNRR